MAEKSDKTAPKSGLLVVGGFFIALAIGWFVWTAFIRELTDEEKREVKQAKKDAEDRAKEEARKAEDKKKQNEARKAKGLPPLRED